MNKLLKDVVLDHKNPYKLYKLAREYDKLKQGAGAFSFYMRASEFNNGETFEEKWIQYKSLVSMGNIYKRNPDRWETVDSLFKSAITVLPNRPEAYYFLAHMEALQRSRWQDGYLISMLGLQHVNSETIDDDLPYPGPQGLKYINAVSNWKVHGNESSKLSLFNFKHLTHHDEEHDKEIDKWIASSGYPHRVPYEKKDLESYKFPFAGIENIEKNYARHYQDMFVLSMLHGKRNGKFIELGSGDPYVFSNTALLEDQFGWTGISIDNDERAAAEFVKQRKSTMILGDAAKIDYKLLFKSNCIDDYVDYLRINAEHASLHALQNMPFNKYRFGVIQFQHNAIWWGDKFRNESRDVLSKAGYVLVGNDISTSKDTNYEDWWVHPQIIQHRTEMISDTGKANFALEYMMKENKV